MKQEIHASAVKMNSLQTIRALAFLGIFTSHCGATSLGAWGVSVFFILSGFLMTYAYYNKDLNCSICNNLKFSLRKIRKLYPLHILMMIAALIFTIITLINNFTLKHLILYTIQTFLNVVLLQAWIPSSSLYFSLNGVAWYLSVTIFLYAMFPFILRIIKKFSCIKTAFLIAVIIFIIQIVSGFISNYINIPIIYFDNFPKWFTYIFPLYRLGDFCIGCCIGYIFLHAKITISKLPSTLLEIITFICIIISEIVYIKQIGFLGAECFRYTILFTPTSTLLIYLFATNKGLLSKIFTCKPLLFLGNLSSFAFLIHQIVIRYLATILSKSYNIIMKPWIMVIISLAATIICTEIYIYTERYIHILFKNNKTKDLI